MPVKDYNAKYWDQVAKKMAPGQQLDELIAEHYRHIHFDLVTRWTDFCNDQVILKTDLFAEALCPSRAFLLDILKIRHNTVGIDISGEIVCRAKSNIAHYAANSCMAYANCSVTRLPFTSNSFDLIISDSTLDHFRYKGDILIALSELSRVLKPGGTLIITMDNKSNLTDPLVRLWLFLGLAPFYSGKTYNMQELRQALFRVGLNVIDSTAILHTPPFFTRQIVSFLRKVAPNSSNDLIRRWLGYLDSLENRRTKYLTALFVAAKAVKPYS